MKQINPLISKILKNKIWAIILGFFILLIISLSYLLNQEITDSFFNLIGFIIVLGFYLLPGIIAGFKKKKNQTAIFWFNVLLGWTGIGWIAALIWSLCND